MPSFTLAGHKLPWSHSRDCPWTLTPAEAQSNWIHPSAGIAIKSAAPDYTRNLQPQSKTRVRSQKPQDSLPDQLTQEHTEDTPKDTHLGEEQPSLLLVEYPTFSIREFHPFCVRLWSVSQRGISSSSVQLQGVWLSEKRWTRKQPEETSAPPSWVQDPLGSVGRRDSGYEDTEEGYLWAPASQKSLHWCTQQHVLTCGTWSLLSTLRWEVAHWVQAACLAHTKSWVPSPIPHKLGMVGHSSNSSTQKVEKSRGSRSSLATRDVEDAWATWDLISIK